MKKIDLHIHTVNTQSDPDFEFSLDALKGYVKEKSLDAIAITNHNLFDDVQFRHYNSVSGN
jgi:predicted metal-dependent phosphoesterase TrpH